MAKKLFYKIGEACKQVDVQPYVLRYWETEFELLSPDKSKSGQRVYTEDDLAIIRRIKELLYDEGYTTVGAKKKLQAELEEGDGKLPAASSSKPMPPKQQASKEEEPEQADSEQAEKKVVEAASSDPVPEPVADDSQRVEELEAGLRGALDQARDILQRLA